MSARRPLLLPLAPLYRSVLAIKRLMLRLGWLKQGRLPSPVISVGSISAGGAGKTPLVILLAGILSRRGYAVSILTRGYRRASKLTGRVEPYDDPRWQGDEPVLLAQRAGVPVFAGSDRYQAGLLAEKDTTDAKTAVHLLDDGFQHRRLARDVDIVLLTKEDVDDHLLPAGNLREPLSALRGADVIVLREEEAEELKQVLAGMPEFAEYPESAPRMWVIRRRLRLEENGEPLPTMPLAFCGIARPESFTQMLSAVGYEPMETMAFEDHHSYGDEDVTRLLERARQLGANGFVTTEKDAVKITPEMHGHLAAVGPLIVSRLIVELVDEKEALFQLITMVGELDRRKR
ncbi:tetraacyldisaccharide 4'-kinase [Edaphobacter bradus]|uniref:tetraacyldisaccharide 4'-kinase n=1 Tax=Edaphobacter bradus TaxID=2259016 RepID=UPI0021E083BE|nr:tetraacyldisaccharide 4'-kinase [Edaphobacter bradus]